MHLRNSPFMGLCIPTTGCQLGRQKLPSCPMLADQHIRGKNHSFYSYEYFFTHPPSFVCQRWRRSPGKEMTKFLHHTLPQLKYNTLICHLFGAPRTFHTKCNRCFNQRTVWIRFEVFVPDLCTVRFGLSTISLKTAAIQHLVLLSHLHTPAEEGLTQRAINGALFLILTCIAKTTVFL